MSSLSPRSLVCLVFVMVFSLLAACARAPGVKEQSAAVPDSAASVRVVEGYGKLPLGFEENRGQSAAEVKFLARGPGYGLYLTPGEAVLALKSPSPRGRGVGVRGSKEDFFLKNAPPMTHAMEEKGVKSQFPSPHPNPLPEGEGANSGEPQGAVLRMRLAGAREPARMVGRDVLPGTVNYLKGRDPGQWRTGVTRYGKVEYQGVYPGIDLVYYGNQRQLEYDFVVAPGADPKVIRLSFAEDGRAAVPRLEANGDLLVPTGAGEVRLHKPVVYQEVDGQRRGIEGRFVVADGQIGFQVADYDRGRALVIDPVLVYSTYLGGSALDSTTYSGWDIGSDIAIDGAGNAYITGKTYSTDFPALNTKYQNWGGNWDAFITTPNPAKHCLVQKPSRTRLNPQKSRLLQLHKWMMFDRVGSKLSADGTSILYSIYLGGNGEDEGHGITVDSAGNIYVTGHTSSPNFPTENAKYPELGGAFTPNALKKYPLCENVVSLDFTGVGADFGGPQLG